MKFDAKGREVLNYKATDNYFIEAARGNISGHTTINKFGRNTAIGSGVTADIWDGGYTGDVSLIWVAPTAARTHTIASTDANDTTGGSGARTVRITGLTDWDTAQVSEDVTMNTGSPPVTSNSYVIIHRLNVLTKGATNSNTGVITATATTDGTITAQINALQGQSQMVIYGIPSTQKLYLGRFYGNANKSGGASGGVDATLLVNPEPDAELTNFVVRHTFGIQTTGTSALTINYYTPKVIVGPAIVKVQCLSGAAGMDVSAGFDGVLIDN